MLPLGGQSDNIMNARRRVLLTMSGIQSSLLPRFRILRERTNFEMRTQAC
jgi:hypothetical protein